MSEKEFIEIIKQEAEKTKNRYNRTHRRNGQDLITVRWDRRIRRINNKLKPFRK